MIPVFSCVGGAEPPKPIMACPYGTVDDGFLEFIIGPDPVAQRLRTFTASS